MIQQKLGYGYTRKVVTKINDVFKAHNKDGYLIAVSDGTVKHMYLVSFGWVLSTEEGVHLATSHDGCEGLGSVLRAEAVGILSIFLFHSTNCKTQKAHQHQDHLCI